MNNKIQFKFNYALLLSCATAICGYKSCRETISVLLIKYESGYSLLSDRPAAFIPIIVLKKNL
uniref:Uncharacterized protein n=1 Tax=Pyropia pulchra TaxID=60925 RepID=A0A141SFC6_9RHOD|nr:hypothetical protein Ppul_167 [Pyropia pulchra]AMK96994.1 hypothetical protein Ppul_167 [Pyropia pulchra]